MQIKDQTDEIHTKALQNLALIYSQKGQYSKAVKTLTKSIDIKPTPKAHYLRAMALKSINNSS